MSRHTAQCQKCGRIDREFSPSFVKVRGGWRCASLSTCMPDETPGDLEAEDTGWKQDDRVRALEFAGVDSDPIERREF